MFPPPESDNPTPDLEHRDSKLLQTSNKEYREYVFSEAWQGHKPKAFFDYRELWDRAAQQRLELDAPLNVDIETTTVCNLSCPMCARTKMVEDGEIDTKGMMTRDEYASIIDQCAEMGVSAIKLNYNGEPLAHKDVVWQVQYAKEKGILDVIFNSNGLLLTKALGEQLLLAGLDGLFISVDAASPDLYAMRRPGGDLGKLTTNIYEFLKLRRKIAPGCRTRLAMVMGKEEIWPEQFHALAVIWGSMVDNLGYSREVNYQEYGSGNLPKVMNWACSQPFQRLVLKLNGNATVCCPDNWDELSVGNWREESLASLWRGEKFTRLRQTHRDGNYDLIGRCKECHVPHVEFEV